ncbi:MAG: hypothetical protein KF764_01345 [Labilithrix sp.]|nr:hypothetical protein [Labilithrix sp.]MBX3225081.1 hypothetical protein [Labilithrix sp.]
MRNASSRSRRTPAFELAVAGLVTIAALAAAACSDGTARACRVGADCASGMCGDDGTCVDGPGATPGSSGSNGDGGGDDADDAGALPPDDGGNLALPGCAPNKDGVITRDEVPIQAGLRATFRVAENVDVSTAGEALANGRRRWDLSGTLTNDASMIVETLPLAGKWYAPKYTSATYATQLRKASDLVGVFETLPDGLRLHGVVSPNEGLTKTELTNDPPVTMLQFPLSVGVKWNSETNVRGYAQGIYSSYTEKYAAEVDKAGELVTPLGTFEVLRVRIDLTRTVGIYTTTVRSYAFITECYGNVASIASRDNEKDVDFSRAVEVRRIAP